MGHPILSSVNCRMARAALDWTQARLAGEAHITVRVILDFEAGVSTPRRNNLRAIVLAFESAGVRFEIRDGQMLVLPPSSPGLKAVAAD